jgi:hypothetical protein
MIDVHGNKKVDSEIEPRVRKAKPQSHKADPAWWQFWKRA